MARNPQSYAILRVVLKPAILQDAGEKPSQESEPLLLVGPLHTF